MLTVGITAAVFLIILMAGFAGYTRLVHRPPEDKQTVLVASGRRYLDKQGRPQAFRIIRSERYVRYPVIESVQPFSLEPLEIEWETTAAPAELDQNFRLEGTAVIRPSRDDADLRTAIRNFIGLDRAEIARAAAVSIESTVQHDLQDVPADRARDTEDEWTTDTARRAADELDEFGLVLDDFQVVSVVKNNGA